MRPMALAPGNRVGPYEVVELIGKGGMGEVYRGRDSRLGRSVAIKILSHEFASDPARVERFEREARTLAALNHPHIAIIHGVEDAQGAPALIMELVDGETLDESIARGALSVPIAMRIAREIAEALDAAHEKGIVHRDLKPANIKLTSTGTVKVLDFGIAKASTGESDTKAANDASRLTAVATMGETLPGVVLGTVAYMSPEQARGQNVDKRTDIWAFGCVLFEMLTGRAAFARATVTDTLAAVIEREPDWSSLPRDIPAGVLRLLRKCLEKDPRRRLRDLGDVDVAIEPGTATPSQETRLRWIPWVALGLSIVVGGWLALNRTPTGVDAPAPPIRFEIPPSVTLSESGQFSVSPDGRHLVFAGTSDDRILRLWIQSFDVAEVRPLLGTEAEVVPVIPPMFWSPDSQFIGFYSGGKIKKVSRSGGTPEVLCEVPGPAIGGSWNRDGVIVVGNINGALLRCSASGGVAASFVTATKGGEDDHLMPSFLPDGRRFIYLSISRANPSRNGLFLGDLALPPDQQSDARLVETGFGGTYVAGSGGPGYVMFVRNAALLAMAFDPVRGLVTGEPVEVAKPVGAFRDTAFFTASTSTVVYRGVTSDFQLTWVDRHGKTLGLVGEPGALVRMALSPDGARAVVVRENRQNRPDQDLWMVDLVRNATTRFTSDLMFESAPAWTADGTEVWYALGTGQSQISRKRADGAGAPEIVLDRSTQPRINPAANTLALSATPAGPLLVVTVESSAGTRNDLWMLMQRPGAKPVPLIEQEFDQTEGQFSPDGRWIAYVSNESGSNEVFVRAVTGSLEAPALGASILVSRGGGMAPRWRADSGELLYRSLTGTIMAAPVVSGSIGTPVELARVPGALFDWGVSPDGQRFLVAMPAKQTVPPPFTVLLNWQTSRR
jgi:eukaryotic-like serine/threonine-protein kinase